MVKVTDIKDKKLTPKQVLFVKEYLVDLNAAAAARRAGYSEHTARFIGTENLSKPNIQKAITEATKKREEKVEVTANYVLSNLILLTDRCMQAVEVLDKEGCSTGEWKFDSKGAAKGLELLGKHLSLFVDRVQIGTDPSDPIMQAIARAAGAAKGLPKPVKED